MPSIALIGGDGAGKTTLARMLVEAAPQRLHYLYMGVNVESSNVALPTSRLISVLKRRRNGDSASAVPSAGRNKGGNPLRNALRLINRLAEEWFRQAVSWFHQMRGRLVIYDRHFLFDFAKELDQSKRLPLSKRLHLWHLQHLYPVPDLVIFLDVPPRVLLARKGEATAQWLADHRRAVLKMGKGFANFHRIDADRALPDVFQDVAATVERFRNSPTPRKGATEAQSAQRSAASLGTPNRPARNSQDCQEAIRLPKPAPEGASDISRW